MCNPGYKHYFYAVGLFLLASVAALWSWNTLSELFNLPQAQYRHILAAFFLLLILKWGLSSKHRTMNRVFGRNYEHSSH
jgi:hypothetical protein